MFGNIKKQITELAYAAVNVAEDTLKSSTGQEKKAVAIDYVIAQLPLISPLKAVISAILSKFIDEAVEKAVTYMNSVKNSEA